MKTMMEQRLNKTQGIKYLSTLVTALVLGACSSGGDNLKVSGNTTKQNSDGSFKYTSCSGKNCVNTEFTLEPVKGLNYSCNTVNNVTDVSSILTCPADSEMDVFIKYPEGQRQIKLGSLKVEANSKNDNASNFLQRVSLVSLVDSNISSLEDPKAITAINIVRLLDALSDRDRPYNAAAPVNQMSIPNKYKENMDELLASDVTLDDFKDDAFIKKTRAWLASHGKSVSLSPADAKKRLEKSLKVLNAGMYYQVPTLSGTSLGSNASFEFNSGISISGESSNDNESVNMAIYAQSNREGATIGQGMHWQNEATNAVQRFNLFRDRPFKKMRFVDPVAAQFAPLTNKITGYDWQLFEVDQETGEQSNAGIQVNMSKGEMLRDFVMIGTSELYKTYFGTTNADTEILGAWTQSANGSSSTQAKGQATILKFTGAQLSTFFDPAVWRSQSVVASGERYVFPLHITLSFKFGKNNINVEPRSCFAEGCDFKKKGKLGITILENGDILTDGSGTIDEGFVLGEPNCKPATLGSGKYADETGFNERRIGTIRATTQQIGNQNGSFINPSILLSGAEFGELDGVHIGTRVASSLITMNIAGVVTAAGNTSGNGSVNIFDVSGNKLTTATWANPYSFFTLLNVQKKRGTNSGYKLTDYQQNAINYQSGEVTAALSDCYTIKKK